MAVAKKQDCILFQEVTGRELADAVRQVVITGECNIISVTKTKERMLNADYLVVYDKPIEDALEAADADTIPCLDPLVTDDYE